MISYGRQSINEDDIAAVVEVLRGEFLTQGQQIPLFEAKIAAYCGANYAIAVNSATSALHCACLALGLGVGDYLWTTPISFVASANCALYCGAKVDFVDIDKATGNLSADALAAKLAQAAKDGTLPKIVVVVHMTGLPADMAAIHALSQIYGFAVIEDASHAIGASYQGEMIGNCRYSDCVVFSFHPVKLITTGEGGMVLTNRQGLSQRLQLLRSHGITRDPSQMQGEPEGAWYYQQITLGYNYRMTDMQAALGISQLKRLPEFIAKRRAIAAYYDLALHDLPVSLPWRGEGYESAWHLYVIRCPSQEKNPKANRNQLFQDMRQADIGVNVHYIPIHRQPYYQAMGFQAGMFPHAEAYYQEALTLPLYPDLSQDQQDYVIAELRRRLI